jgi:hypothetical protein
VNVLTFLVVIVPACTGRCKVQYNFFCTSFEGFVPGKIKDTTGGYYGGDVTVLVNGEIKHTDFTIYTGLGEHD